MCKVVQSPEHCQSSMPANRLIHEAEGCPAVVRLLRDEQASCRSGAAATVTHMAPNPLTRLEQCLPVLTIHVTTLSCMLA